MKLWSIMKPRSIKPLLLGVLFFTVSFAIPAMATNTDCNTWPEGLVFVGLTDTGWQTFAVKKTGHKPKKISLNTEARTPSLSHDKKSIMYIDEMGRVKVFLLKEGKARILLEPSAQAGYAQPEYDNTNNFLYVVQLKQGKSVDTDIVRLDLTNNTIKPIVTQRSAQFEPFLANSWLYYSNVHCVVGCGKIIQELWRYHTISGMAEQLTLLGNISRQPTVDEKNTWLYFSSNAAGNYHLYRQSLMDKTLIDKTLVDKTLEQLTQGAVTDMSPVIHRDRLYFIRHDGQSTSLMCRNNRGEFSAMDLPRGVKDIRDLEMY